MGVRWLCRLRTWLVACPCFEVDVVRREAGLGVSKRVDPPDETGHVIDVCDR